jgi:hypothetical protein
VQDLGAAWEDYLKLYNKMEDNKQLVRPTAAACLYC